MLNLKLEVKRLDSKRLIYCANYLNIQIDDACISAKSVENESVTHIHTIEWVLARVCRRARPLSIAGKKAEAERVKKSNTLKTEVGSVAIRGSEWGRGSGIGWNEMDWQAQRCSNRTQHSVRCCHYCWCCCCCSRLEKLLIFSIRVRIQFDFHRARTKKLPTF